MNVMSQSKRVNPLLNTASFSPLIAFIGINIKKKLANKMNYIPDKRPN